MALRYAQKWQVVLYGLLAIIKSLQAVFVAYIMQQYINFAQKPQGSLLHLLIFAVVGLFGFGIMNILYQALKAKITQDVNLKIKTIATNYMVRARDEKAKIDVSFMTNDLKQLETNRIGAELEIIFNVLQFLAAIISAVIGSWLLSLIFLIASLTPALVQKLLGPKIEAKSAVWESDNRLYTNTVNDTVNGSAMADLYDVEPSMISRLIHSAQKMETALWRTNFLKGTANETTIAVAYIFGIFIPFSFGIYLVTRGQIMLGTFMMVVQLANNFINPIVAVFSYVNDMKTAAPIWKRFKKISRFEAPETTPHDADHFKQLIVKDAGVKLGGRQIFKHVDLTIYPGKKLLLVAPSGWGKSTLLNVLTGNKTLNEGSYQIDGQDLNGKWNQAHGYFSFIQQKPFILNDTLKYNITLGRSVSEDRLKQVINAAGLTPLVSEKGLDYMLSANGANLSGGQNQRVEIARALLTNRPILIADEATSSLDNELSKRIHQTILKDFKGTVIEVAHKVSDEEKGWFDQVVKLG